MMNSLNNSWSTTKNQSYPTKPKTWYGTRKLSWNKFMQEFFKEFSTRSDKTLQIFVRNFFWDSCLYFTIYFSLNCSMCLGNVFNNLFHRLFLRVVLISVSNPQQYLRESWLFVVSWQNFFYNTRIYTMDHFSNSSKENTGKSSGFIHVLYKLASSKIIPSWLW